MLAVGDDYRFVTARQCPKLLLVKVSVDKGAMCFDAPGMERLRVPVVHEIGSEQDAKLTKYAGVQQALQCSPFYYRGFDVVDFDAGRVMMRLQ